MPDEDTERVRRSFEAINQRDFEALIALTDPEVIAIPRLLTVEGGILRGHAGVRTWWESILAAFPDFEATVIDVSAVGSATVCNVLFRGRGAESEATRAATLVGVHDMSALRQRLERAHSEGEVGLTRFGQLHPARPTDEKRRPELLLEPLEARSQSRLRDEQTLSRAADAPLPGDLDECRQLRAEQ